MAKSVSLDDALLSGLRKAVQAFPVNLPLFATGGLFPGGAKGKQLAEAAIAQGFLIVKEEVDRNKRKPKTVVYGLITEKGIRRVVDADSLKSALEALLPALQALGKPPDPPNPEAFRAALAKATDTCVNATRQAFSQLEGEVLKVLGPPSAPAADPRPVLNSLKQALERVQATVRPTVPSVPEPRPDPGAVSTSALEDAIVTFVNAWAKEKTVGCPFDDLWNHLQGRRPSLTIGVFQDALRALHQAGRIRLSGWAKMLDDLPHPQLALFVSSKVMYYAQPTRPNG